MTPLSVVCWRWGNLFSADYVNRLRSMLERNLRLPHTLFCVTDDVTGIDRRVRCVPMPDEFAGTIRCRRRMWMHSRDRRELFGPRMLAIDLDTVIVDDITPIVERPEPLVMLRISYANKLSPAFMLSDVGVLHDAYAAFAADPIGYPAATGERNASDLAMLNHFLRGKSVAHWTERDGFVLYFGKGYERFEHLGIGPNRPDLPPYTRVVVLGSEDKHVLDNFSFDWVSEHWRNCNDRHRHPVPR